MNYTPKTVMQYRNVSRVYASLFASTVTAVGFAAPSLASNRPIPLEHFCHITQTDAAGTWSATRRISDTGGKISAGRDEYEWEPTSGIEFGPGMSLKWDVSYYWPADARAQKIIPAEDVILSMKFYFEPQEGQSPFKKPNHSWLHFYRLQDPVKAAPITAASMTSFMLWHKYSDGSLGTKAALTLDELLAFGTGYNALVWNLRSAPDEFGRSIESGKGLLPITAIRVVIPRFQQMRRQLEKQAANYRKFCPISTPVTVTLP